MAKNESRVALLVGATGLTGSALLPLLLSATQYSQVHVLARRPLAHAGTTAKLVRHVVDFDALASWRGFPHVDDVYCCLGTTIRVAGSQAAFRRVDCDYVVETARCARARGARRLVVISAMGAGARSLVFYNRVKGEMEDAVRALGFDSVTLVRPSFLAGDRAQSRPGERLALAFTGLLEPLIPKKYRTYGKLPPTK